MKHADHHLGFTGVWHGIPMWELHCAHGETAKFHMDDEGNHSDECLIQGWWDNDGFDIIDTTTNFNQYGHALLWTTWNYSSEPLLVGRDGFEQWKEEHEQDQTDD